MVRSDEELSAAFFVRPSADGSDADRRSARDAPNSEAVYTFRVGGFSHVRREAFPEDLDDPGQCVYLAVMSNMRDVTIQQLIYSFVCQFGSLVDLWPVPPPAINVHKLPWRAAILYPAPADERPLVASPVAMPLGIGPDHPRSPWCIDGQRFEPSWSLDPDDYDRPLVSFDAILMCCEASLKDPEIVRLCSGIEESQRREIDEMKDILARK